MPRPAQWAAALIGVVALCAFYLRVSHDFIRTSDDARMLLEAEDLVRGNWNLHGWILTSDNFWTSEAPLYAPLIRAAGPSFALLFQVPAVVYALVVAAACTLAARPHRGLAAAAAAIATGLVIGLPPALWGANFALAAIVLRPAIHVVTILFGLLALGLIERAADTTSGALRIVPQVMTAAALLGAATAGDPLAGWMFAVPVGVISCWDLLAGARRAGAIAGAWLAASLAISGGLLRLEAATHGFVDVHTPIALVSWRHMPGQAAAVLAWWLRLCGGDVVGLPPSAQTALVFGRCAVCLSVLGCVAAELVGWVRRRERGRWLDAVLASIVVLSALEMTVSTQGGQSRYVVPSVIAGAILAGRRIGTWADVGAGVRRIRALGLALAAALAVSLASSLFFLGDPPARQPERPVATWLEQHGLRNGYGAYWDASIITAETSGRVRVRPVVAEGGRLTRWLMLSKDAWYRVPPQFVVFTGNPTIALEHGMMVAVAERTLGRASQIVRLGDYTIVVR